MISKMGTIEITCSEFFTYIRRTIKKGRMIKYYISIDVNIKNGKITVERYDIYNCSPADSRILSKNLLSIKQKEKLKDFILLKLAEKINSNFLGELTLQGSFIIHKGVKYPSQMFFY